MASISLRNQTLVALAAKKQAKVYIKLFFSCPILLDFSILLKKVFRGCRLIQLCRIRWWISFFFYIRNNLSWVNLVQKLKIVSLSWNFVPTIIFIIFRDSLIFCQIFLSPEVKRCAIITYKHGVCELSHELPNHLRLGILGN